MATSRQILAVLVAAGDGIRLGRSSGKALVALAGRPLFVHSLATLLTCPEVARIALVVRECDRNAVETALAQLSAAGTDIARVIVVAGGSTRQASVLCGLEALAARVPGDGPSVVLIHDAARPLASPGLFCRVGAAVTAEATDVAVAPALRITDTVRAAAGVVADRASLRAVQTPQAAPFAFALAAHRAAVGAGSGGGPYADDLSLCEAYGAQVRLIEGEQRNLKVTVPADLDVAAAFLMAGRLPRTGIGFDIHPLIRSAGGAVRLGGVSIPADAVLQGHSDADVAVHAVMDALLGAAAAGDIGQWFPPGVEQWRGADSIVMLSRVWTELAGRGYLLGNVDVTVQAEWPRLSPHYQAMRSAIAGALSCPVEHVSIKATTMEGLGPIGRGEGIAAMATATIFCQAAAPVDEN